MELFLSHTTALTFWRTASAHQAESTLPCKDLPSDGCTRSPQEARLLVQGTVFQDWPLHVLLPEGRTMRPQDGIALHHVRLLPRGSFRSYSNDIFIASPELTFAQAATFLTLPELVIFGNELCAPYVRDPYNPKGFSDRPAPTNLKALKHILGRLGSFDGKNRALRALRFISPNTASPAESELAAHLALSKMLGGAGFTKFECNKELLVPRHLQHLSDQRTVTPDMCWPDKKVAIEYESNDFHTGADRITHDSIRRNTLIAMGYNVICITRGQTRRACDLLIEDQKIARALGVRWRPTDPCYEIKAQQCWRALEHWTYTDPKELSLELDTRNF